MLQMLMEDADIRTQLVCIYVYTFKKFVYEKQGKSSKYKY